MRGKFLGLAIAALFASLPLLAQEAKTATPQPSRLAVHAAQLFDAKTGSILKDQAIFIEGDKIVKVGPAPKEIHQAKANIDYPGFGTNVPTMHVVSGTVLPGLIGREERQGYARSRFHIGAQRC